MRKTLAAAALLLTAGSCTWPPLLPWPPTPAATDSGTVDGGPRLPTSTAPAPSLTPPPVPPGFDGQMEEVGLVSELPTSSAITDDWFAANTGSLPPEYVSDCESGGNYQADNHQGHTGRWQFSEGTWESVGGSGRAMDASPQEQDYRASLLWADGGGAGHWSCF